MLRSPLLLAALTVVLLPSAVSVAAPNGSGGALAQPVQQGSGGGHAAPAAPGAPAATDVVDGDAEADGGVEAALPSQEPGGETPTTPEGGEQPNGDIPEDDTGDGADDGEIVGSVGELGEGGGEGGAEVSGGFLPSTGLRLAALSAIGLALLTAGLALRPPARR